MNKEYARYLKSPEWLNKREEILAKYDYICQRCFKNAANTVHHYDYDPRADDSHLMAICKGCHAFIHGKIRHDPAMNKKKKIIVNKKKGWITFIQNGMLRHLDNLILEERRK